jgi:hypothetical protein
MVREIFETATSSMVGDGATAFFWMDKWLPDGCLMSHKTRWETPRGRYDEHSSKFSLL